MRGITRSQLLLLTPLFAAGSFMACQPPPPPGVGTIVFDVLEIPPGIDSVVARVEGESGSLRLSPVNTDSAGLGARGAVDVQEGTDKRVWVDAYSGLERWYEGRDTVDVVANDTVFATVALVCIHPGCDGSVGGNVRVMTFFPRAESEPNNSTVECDTTSWARNVDYASPGVPAPYSYGGNGTVSSESDADYWCPFIDFTAGDTLVAFTVSPAGSGLDPVLTLIGPTGSVLTSNDNAGGENPSDARVNWRVAAGGRYYLRVSAASAPTAPGRYSVFMHTGVPGAMP